MWKFFLLDPRENIFVLYYASQDLDINKGGRWGDQVITKGNKRNA